MKLAVLDTNLLISAGITTGGSPAKLILDCVLKERIQVVTSPAVVEEYREVVRRPRFQKYRFPPLWLETLIEESLWLHDPEPWMHTCPDPTDAPFLALAHASGAWLVTGNLRHFPESVRYGVNVLSPADYLAHLIGNEGTSK
jgi:putative PIN family toxin of toxin-antitoxin system